MRFEVPQFIEIEDKIVGPFTWKQFIYVAGGAGASFILYVLLPFFVFIIVAAPVIAFTAGLAFYKVNNRPLSILLEAMFQYASRSRLYLWKKQKDRPIKKQDEVAPVVYKPPKSGSNLASLSRSLEIKALQKK